MLGMEEVHVLRHKVLVEAVVRTVVFPRRKLTVRFQALANHYLCGPCFAQPGEGHDKGGVGARG